MNFLRKIFDRLRTKFPTGQQPALSYDTPAEWLQSLPKWDGVKRLDQWLSVYAGADDSERIRLIGRYYLLGMVARAMEPGCKFDACLVLLGSQGCGKSSMLRTLAGQWLGYIYDITDRSSPASMSGKWICEIADFSELVRSEQGRLKGFLTRQVDEYRPAYGERSVRVPRTTVFAATTNDPDIVASRRAWAVECRRVDIDGLASVRNQLFAEALHCYRQVGNYWPSQQEAEQLEPADSRQQSDDPMADALADWVAKRRKPFSIDEAAQAIGIQPGSTTRDMQTRIGIALRKLGCTAVQMRNPGPANKRQRLYARPATASNT